MQALTKCCCAAMLLIAAIAAVSVHAQAQGSEKFIDLEKLANRPGLSSSQVLSAEQIPTDDVVDPEIYILGPGDVLSYMTSGLDFSEKLVVVSPECTVLMERFGVVDVKGKSLRQLRDSLTAVYKNRVPDSELYLSLKRARTVYVTLKGNVSYPGTYAVPASMRVSTFLVVSRQPWLLNGSKLQMERSSMIHESTVESALTRNSSSSLSGYAARNITIRHRDNSDLVDLPKSRLPGYSRFDPHLREGDIVTVPFDAETYASITISGAVVLPTTLEYKAGDKASILLSAAGGITSDADIHNITLVQSDGEGRILIKVDSNFNIVDNDPELQPGSTIIVERIPKAGSDARQGVVEVYGEVQTPGSVIIQPGITKLNEVITKCHGIAKNASLSLSYVVRPDLTAYSDRKRYDDAKRNFMYSDLTLEDTVRYQLDQSYRLPYVSCDVARALTDTSSADNIVLHAGDIIVIAANPNRVFVYGQVNQPGYIAYSPKKSLDWYVEQAGGFATGAKSGRARIIRGRTKVWVEDGDAYVESGDEVYVPRAPDVPPGIQMQTYAVVAGILSSVAAITYTILAISSR